VEATGSPLIECPSIFISKSLLENIKMAPFLSII
jgi:hypothetical protein